MPEEEKKTTTNKPATNNDSNDTLMGVLAYLGILCLIPLLAAKDSEFAQYHAKQGVTLFALEILLWVVQWLLTFMAFSMGFGFFGIISMLIWLVWIGTLVLAIIGIVNVVNKKMAPLPLIGGIKIIK